MNTSCFVFPTTRSGHAAWVADPVCRGSFGIISLCLSTTVICIWSSVHRDIPLKRQSFARSLQGEAPLILVALFAPEILFFLAFDQYIGARKLVKMASKSDAFKQQPGEHHNASQANGRYRENPFTFTHGFYAGMGGFAFLPVKGDGTTEARRAILTREGVEYVMQKCPELIPDLSHTSITDRSKSSALGKAVLAVQLEVAWFCLNCASRLTEHLPLTLLEVSTLAHGFMTPLSYATWWYKPLNVNESTVITMSIFDQKCAGCIRREDEKKGSTSDTAAKEHSSTSNSEEVLKDISKEENYHTFQPLPSVYEIFFSLHFASNPIFALFFFIFMPTIYGSFHLLGWHSQFPSAAERKLWHIASVSVASTGGMFLVVGTLLVSIEGISAAKPARRIIDVIFYIAALFYLVCTSFLLIESVRQLWYLPPEAYVDASWSYYIPHWL